MKKIFLSMLLIAGALTSQAAKKTSPIADVKEVNFYGIDYSKCQTTEVSDNPDETVKALSAINHLFVSEPKKFNIERFTQKKSGVIDVSVGTNLTESMKVDSLNALAGNHRVTDAEVESTIKGLELKETSGTGLILIGECLNKIKTEGTYRIVFFDIASRNIIADWEETGKAGGFGLRNYWAKTVFTVMDGIKNKKQ